MWIFLNYLFCILRLACAVWFFDIIFIFWWWLPYFEPKFPFYTTYLCVSGVRNFRFLENLACFVFVEHVWVSGGKKCSFFGKFGVLCFLETPVLRFTLFLYYRRNRLTCSSRSSRSQMLFKIDVLKNFENFTGKQLWLSHFLIKLQVWRPATSLKRDSSTGIFLWNLPNFKNTFFCRTTLVAASVLPLRSWRMFSIRKYGSNVFWSYFCSVWKRLFMSAFVLNKSYSCIHFLCKTTRLYLT